MDFGLLTQEIAKDGPRNVADPHGNTYVIEERQASRKGGMWPGETFSAWLRRTLPPGEGIDTYRIRNPEGSQHRDGWILDMLDEEDDRSDAKDAETPSRREMT